jgi:hypothetical protein
MDEAQRLAKKLELGFPVVADPELALIRKFGVEMQGREIAIPSMFVLEAKTGRVTWRYIGETMFDRPKLHPCFRPSSRPAAPPVSTASTTPAPTSP